MLLASLSTSSANIAMPTLQKAFAASFPAVQWVVLAYLLSSTALVVGAGRIGDLFGRRRLLRLGLLLFTAASALCAAAPSLGWLIAARALQGIGGAMMMALAMALAGETVPKERLGRAMGLLGTMSAVGTALGPSLGGLLIDGLGWQAIFLAGVPLGALAILLARRLPADRQNRDAARPRFDAVGTLLLALALAAYALGVTLDLGEAAWILLPAAVLAGAAFVAVERRTVSPLIRLSLLRDPALSAGLVMLGLVSAVMMATLVIGPFHLSQALGLDTTLVGLVVAAGPVVVALTASPAGRLADSLGAPRTTILGLLGMALGCALLSVAPLRFGWAGYVLPLLVVTAGYALFQTANNSAVMGGADPERRGLIAGLLHLSRNLGLVTGTAAMGALFLRASGSLDLASAAPASVAQGTSATFAAATAIIVVTLAIALGGRALAARRTTPAAVTAGIEAARGT
jgi:EmrB/QacA subfamily drug resistance transporter